MAVTWLGDIRIPVQRCLYYGDVWQYMLVMVSHKIAYSSAGECHKRL